MTKLNFNTQDKSNWGDLQAQVSDELLKCLASGNSFSVEFGELKESKSWQQIKAIHKLCQLLAPRLSEAYGTKFDMEDAKLAIKLKFGYLRAPTMNEAISEALFIKSKLEAFGEKINKKSWGELLSQTFNDKTPRKPKSFADATKEEMVEMIEKIHALADLMGWNECKITSQEMQSLIEYYNKKEV